MQACRFLKCNVQKSISNVLDFSKNDVLELTYPEY